MQTRAHIESYIMKIIHGIKSKIKVFRPPVQCSPLMTIPGAFGCIIYSIFIHSISCFDYLNQLSQSLFGNNVPVSTRQGESLFHTIITPESIHFL